MELRGAIRGGRFVAGVGGEQFAYSEIVDALRKVNKDKKNSSVKKHHCLSATDPLNILDLLLPNRKLSRLLIIKCYIKVGATSCHRHGWRSLSS